MSEYYYKQQQRVKAAQRDNDLVIYFILLVAAGFSIYNLVDYMFFSYHPYVPESVKQPVKGVPYPHSLPKELMAIYITANIFMVVWFVVNLSVSVWNNKMDEIFTWDILKNGSQAMLQMVFTTINGLVFFFYVSEFVLTKL